MAVTGRLVALAASCVLLALISSGALAVAFAALVLLVVLDLVLAARIASVRFAREPSAAVRLGQTGRTVLAVTNAGGRRLRAELRDAWVPSAGALERLQALDVPAGERRRVVTSLRPTRRGERLASRVTIRSLGPLRLAGRQRGVVVPGSLRVLPAFRSRRFLPEKLARLRQIDGAVLVRQRGQGSEFDSLRTYVLGDDVRAIDWRASARSRDIVVRTWRPERDRVVLLAIDSGRTSAARIDDEPRLDAAVDACLLLSALAARAGDRVGLVAADVAVRARLEPSHGRDLLATVVAALTPLEPLLVETDPALLAAELLRSARKRSLVVLFSSLDTVDAQTGVLDAVRALAARHQVVFASVSDPQLGRLAAARADAAEVYTAAAAELAVAARRRAAATLDRLGVLVVDASSERFASRVADAYLDLKAAGRL